jgi:hypothetical protein
MAQSLKAVQNNTAPAYILTCERDDGTIIDLTNTAVTMKLYRGTTQTNTASGHNVCVVQTPATAGNISWTPKVGDFPSPGSYKGDVTVTYIDSTFETLFNNATFKVRKLIGS